MSTVMLSGTGFDFMDPIMTQDELETRLYWKGYALGFCVGCSVAAVAFGLALIYCI